MLSLNLAPSWALADGPPVLSYDRSLEVFPGGTLTLRFPDGNTPSQPVLELTSLSGDVRRIEGTADGDGNPRFLLRCHFLGQGTAKLFDTGQPPTLQPIREFPVRCSWPTPVEAAPTASTQSSRLLATPATTEPAVPVPPGIPGQVQSYESRFSYHSNETETNERADGEELTQSKTIDDFLHVLFANGETCSEQVESGQACCSTTAGSQHDSLGGYSCGGPVGCSSLTPINLTFCQQTPDEPSVLNVNAILSQGEKRELTTVTFSGPGDPRNGTRDYRGTDNGAASVNATWHFPGVEDDQQIDAVQLYADNAFVQGNSNAVAVNGVSPEVSLGPPADIGSTPSCPSYIYPELLWPFEDPPAGNRFSSQLAPIAPTCSFALNSTTHPAVPNGTATMTQTVTGSYTQVVGGIRARTARRSLSLEPVDLVVAPSNRRSANFNILGNSRTVVRARLAGVPANTYRVDLRVDGFDASTTGHAHDQGKPPTGDWGRVAIDPQDFENTPLPSNPPSEDSCDIVVDDTGEGVCDFFFQADEISGRVTLKATSLVGLDTKDGTTTIDVYVRDLIDVRSLIPGLGGVHRNPDIRHIDDNAFYMRSIGAARLLVMLEHFQQLTADPGYPNASSHPQGLALLLNDASLLRGGLFDIEGNWTTPHAGHKNGLGVDINSNGVDRNSLPNITPPVPIDKDTVQSACNKAGGKLVKEVPIHCEFRRF